jgi:hypothetical protein
LFSFVHCLGAPSKAHSGPSKHDRCVATRSSALASHCGVKNKDEDNDDDDADYDDNDCENKDGGGYNDNGGDNHHDDYEDNRRKVVLVMMLKGVIMMLAMLGMTMMLVRPRKHGLANRWSIETKPTF